jgi:hypothetical protein
MTTQEREILSLTLLSRWKHFMDSKARDKWVLELSPIEKELLMKEIQGRPKQLW